MSKTSTTTQDIKLIPVEDLGFIPNRRDTGDLKAMAAGIKEHGIKLPLIIRPMDYEKDGPLDCGPRSYLILDGRRRFEAAKLAGLASVPCILTGEASPDIPLILNTHRLQLSPIELLDSIKDQLVTEPSSGQQNPEAIKHLAAKVNLSVDDTLKLLTLNACSEGIKDLVHAKKMPLNVAILTAHLDKKKLEAFIKFYQGSRPSYRDAKGWFRQNKAALELREAIFITSGCKGCQFHGDHSPALFDQDELGDKDSFSRDDDRCFNPTCWKEKEAEFRQAMKEKAAKQGVPKAGLSVRDLYDTDSMVKFAEAARIQPDNCAECKLVKWYKGHATGGKWVLFCPSSCPNIKQPKGKKVEPERSVQPSIREKLEKNIPLTPAETKLAIEQHRQNVIAKMAADAMDINIKKISGINLVKMILLCAPKIADKKLPQFLDAKLDDLKAELIELLEDLFQYQGGPEGTAQNQSLYLLATGKPLDMARVDEALPENIRALIPPSPADAQKPKKKGKK